MIKLTLNSLRYTENWTLQSRQSDLLVAKKVTYNKPKTWDQSTKV